MTMGWERRTVRSTFDGLEAAPVLDGPYITDGVALSARYGVSTWLEVSVRLPLLIGRYSGDAAATALDDLEFRVRLQPWQADAPASSLSIDLGWDFPGASGPSEVPLIVGAHAVVVGLAYRQQVGPLRVTVDSAGTFRLPSRTISADPSDEWRTGLEAGIQLGPFVIGTQVEGAWFGRSRGAGPETTLAGSLDAGGWVGLSGFAVVQATRGVSFDIAVGKPVWGRSDGTLGPARLHPGGLVSTLNLGVSF